MTAKPLTESQRYLLECARGITPKEAISTLDWHARKVREEALRGEAANIPSNLYLANLNSAWDRGHGAKFITAMVLTQAADEEMMRGLYVKHSVSIKAARKEFIAILLGTGKEDKLTPGQARRRFSSAHKRLQRGED